MVFARFDGKLPTEPSLVIKPLNEIQRRVPLAKNLDDPVFGGSVPEVNCDLAYRIEYGGKQTRDFKVTVYDYPKLERADAKLTYPEYTGLPEKTIADTRRLSAVEGSVLAYTFFLNKPVASANFVAKDKTSVPLVADTNRPAVYQIQFTLDQSWQYELQVVDANSAVEPVQLPRAFHVGGAENAQYIELHPIRGDNSGNEVTIHQEPLRATV